mgnify:CR=1 FL=1|jgi:hypothetical protein
MLAAERPLFHTRHEPIDAQLCSGLILLTKTDSDVTAATFGDIARPVNGRDYDERLESHLLERAWDRNAAEREISFPSTRTSETDPAGTAMAIVTTRCR